MAWEKEEKIFNDFLETKNLKHTARLNCFVNAVFAGS